MCHKRVRPRPGRAANTITAGLLFAFTRVPAPPTVKAAVGVGTPLPAAYILVRRLNDDFWIFFFLHFCTCGTRPEFRARVAENRAFRDSFCGSFGLARASSGGGVYNTITNEIVCQAIFKKFWAGIRLPAGLNSQIQPLFREIFQKLSVRHSFL